MKTALARAPHLALQSARGMKTQGDCRMRKQRIPVVLTFLAATATAAASQEVSENTWPSHQASVDGVWRVTRHGVNCVTGGEVSTFPALMTFHADGTVSGQAV